MTNAGMVDEAVAVPNEKRMAEDVAQKRAMAAPNSRCTSLVPYKPRRPHAPRPWWRVVCRAAASTRGLLSRQRKLVVAVLAERALQASISMWTVRRGDAA